MLLSVRSLFEKVVVRTEKLYGCKTIKFPKIVRAIANEDDRGRYGCLEYQSVSVLKMDGKKYLLANGVGEDYYMVKGLNVIWAVPVSDQELSSMQSIEKVIEDATKQGRTLVIGNDELGTIELWLKNDHYWQMVIDLKQFCKKQVAEKLGIASELVQVDVKLVVGSFRDEKSSTMKRYRYTDKQVEELAVFIGKRILEMHTPTK